MPSLGRVISLPDRYDSDSRITDRIAASEGKDFVKFLSDCSFQYAVAYAVDEGYLHSSVRQILPHHLSEGLHLE